MNDRMDRIENPDFVIIGHLEEGSLFMQRLIEVANSRNINFVVCATLEEAQNTECKTFIDAAMLTQIGIVEMQTLKIHSVNLNMPDIYITELKQKPVFKENRKKKWERPYKYHR